jgi:hypothetical protein
MSRMIAACPAVTLEDTEPGLFQAVVRYGQRLTIPQRVPTIERKRRISRVLTQEIPGASRWMLDLTKDSEGVPPGQDPSGHVLRELS